MYELQKWHPVPEAHYSRPDYFVEVDERVLSREDLSRLLNGRQALIDAFDTLTEELWMAQCSCECRRPGTDTQLCEEGKEEYLFGFQAFLSLVKADIVIHQVF